MKISTLYIATPAAGAMLHAPYVSSLLQCIGALAEVGIQCATDFDHVGWTASARNRQVARFRDRTKFDAIFFVDFDIRPTPEGMISTLAHLEDGCNVVGAFYPKKLVRHPESLPDGWRDWSPGRIYEEMFRQTHPHLPIGKPETLRESRFDGIRTPCQSRQRQEVEWIPTGHLAVSRAAFDCVESAFEKQGLAGEHRYLEWSAALEGTEGRELNLPCFRFFDHPIGAVDGKRQLLGEDVYFSAILRMAGVAIWKVLDLCPAHIGRWVF